jgi:hypothetical protein
MMWHSFENVTVQMPLVISKGSCNGGSCLGRKGCCPPSVLMSHHARRVVEGLDTVDRLQYFCTAWPLTGQGGKVSA